MSLLSIVTPVYNRAKLLERCFQSLLRQSCGDFEWIVVDDGSSDDPGAVLDRLTRQASFPTQFVRKENGGKHTALNAAHPYIHGSYVLILDSDDMLTEDAVEQSLRAWSSWEDNPQVGIVTLLKGRDTSHPNCYGAEEGVPVDIMTGPRICPVSNDACEVIRTELFLRFPFPVFPGERFLAEGALWGRVSFTHKCVYVNRVIYLCEYLEDGLTVAGRAMRAKNPRGGMFHANLYMASKNSLKVRLKNGLLYTCYGCFAALNPREMAALCDHKALMWLCLPFGYCLYRLWKHQLRKHQSCMPGSGRDARRFGAE